MSEKRRILEKILAFVFIAWYSFDHIFGVCRVFGSFAPQAFQGGRSDLGIMLILKAFIELCSLAVAVIWLIFYLKSSEKYKLPVSITVTVLSVGLIQSIVKLAWVNKCDSVLDYFKSSYFSLLVILSWIFLLAINKKAGRIVFAILRWLLLAIRLLVSFVQITKSNLSFMRGGVDKSEISFLIVNTYSFLGLAAFVFMMALLVLYIFSPKLFIRNTKQELSV